MTTTFGIPPATVSGRNIAHGKRNAMERAFLVADVRASRVAVVDLTVSQLATIAQVSQTMAHAAELVAAVPKLRAHVEPGYISLTAAAQSLRPQPKQPQPAPDLFEMFMGASVEARAQCMTAVIDEALALLDDTTSPDFGPAMSDNGLFIQHHL
jgi:hypothetical protein